MKLFIRHPYVLLFGIMQIFFSAPGQTFLISLFVVPMFLDLGMSPSVFAGVYSAATLLASLLLNPAGRLIDRYNLKFILLGNTGLMALGCLFIAQASNLGLLFIGFFLVRLTGQGVFGLTASTTIGKHFFKNRGQAMGIITLGFPFSEMVYPGLALLLLSQVGWRMTYVIFAISMVLVMFPIQWLLIVRSKLKKGEFLEGEWVVQPQRLAGMDLDGEHISTHKLTHYRLKDVLKDPYFFILVLASCVPPLLMTGILFHQETIYAMHNWPIVLAAAGLGAYAVCKAVGSVAIGPVVDKYGPAVPFAGLIFMLGLGTYFAGVGGGSWVIYLYFSLMGAALGISSPVMNVIWPNLYGTEHLGSIKGVVGTFRNGLTSLGPLPIAIAMDMGFSVTKLIYVTSFVVMAMAVIPLWVSRRVPRMNGLN